MRVRDFIGANRVDHVVYRIYINDRLYARFTSDMYIYDFILDKELKFFKILPHNKHYVIYLYCIY